MCMWWQIIIILFITTIDIYFVSFSYATILADSLVPLHRRPQIKLQWIIMYWRVYFSYEFIILFYTVVCEFSTTPSVVKKRLFFFSPIIINSVKTINYTLLEIRMKNNNIVPTLYLYCWFIVFKTIIYTNKRRLFTSLVGYIYIYIPSQSLSRILWNKTIENNQP